MANNIPEKNKAYSFKTYTSLPYPDVKNINYSYENSMLNSSMLNNTYGQLVDNDAFIAQQLNQKSSWTIGPTAVKDVVKSAVDNAPNGTKFFQSLDDPRPYRKVEKPLDQSIRRATNDDLQHAKVQAFIPFEPSQMFVSYHNGTTGNTCVIDLSKSLSRKIFRNNFVSTDEYAVGDDGNLVREPVEIVATCPGPYSGKIFIGHTWHNGVPTAHLLSYDGEIKPNNTQVRKLCSIQGYKMTTITHMQSKNLLVFAACTNDDTPQSNVYTCKIVSGQVDASTIKKVYSTSLAMVNCLMSISDPKCVLMLLSDGTVMASEDGKFQTYEEYKFDVYGFYNDTDNGNLWLATSSGLVCNGRMLIPTQYLSTKSLGYDNGKVYVAESNSPSISSVNASLRIEEVGQHNVQIANDICIADGFIFVGGSAKTTVCPITGKFEDVKVNGSNYPCYALAQSYDETRGKQVIYAAGLSGSSNLSTTLVGFEMGNIESYDSGTLGTSLSTVYAPLRCHLVNVFSSGVQDNKGYDIIEIEEIEYSMHNYAVFDVGNGTKALYDLTLRTEVVSVPKCKGIFCIAGQIATIDETQINLYSNAIPGQLSYKTYQFDSGTTEFMQQHDICDAVLTTSTVDGANVKRLFVIAKSFDNPGSGILASRSFCYLFLDDSTRSVAMPASAFDIGSSPAKSDKIVQYNGNYVVLSGGEISSKMECFGFVSDLAGCIGYNEYLGPIDYPSNKLPDPSSLPQFYKNRNTIYTSNSSFAPGPELAFLSSDYTYSVVGSSKKQHSARYVFSRTDFVVGCGSCGEEVSCVSSLIQRLHEDFETVYQDVISCGVLLERMRFSSSYDAVAFIPADGYALCVCLAAGENDFKSTVQSSPSSIFFDGSSEKMVYGGLAVASDSDKIVDGIVENVSGKALSVIYSLEKKSGDSSSFTLNRWISSEVEVGSHLIEGTFSGEVKNFTYVYLPDSNSYDIMFSDSQNLYRISPGSTTYDTVHTLDNSVNEDIHSVVAVNAGVQVHVGDTDVDDDLSVSSDGTLSLIDTDLEPIANINNFWKIWKINSHYQSVSLAPISADTSYVALVTSKSIYRLRRKDDGTYEQFSSDSVRTAIDSAFTTHIGNSSQNTRYTLAVLGSDSSDELLFIPELLNDSTNVPVKVQDDSTVYIDNRTHLETDLFGMPTSTPVDGIFSDVDNNVWLTNGSTTSAWSATAGIWPIDSTGIAVVPYSSDYQINDDGTVLYDRLSCYAYQAGQDSRLSTIVVDRAAVMYDGSIAVFETSILVPASRRIVSMLDNNNLKYPCICTDDNGDDDKYGLVQTFSYVLAYRADISPSFIHASPSYGSELNTQPLRLVQNSSSNGIAANARYLVELNDHTLLSSDANGCLNAVVWDKSNGQIVFPNNSFDGQHYAVIMDSSHTLWRTTDIQNKEKYALLNSDRIIARFLSDGYDHRLDCLGYDDNGYHLFMSKSNYVNGQTMQQTLGIQINENQQGKSIAFMPQDINTPPDPHSIVKVGTGNYVLACPKSLHMLRYYQPKPNSDLDIYTYQTMAAMSCIPPTIVQATKDGQLNTFVCKDSIVYSSANGLKWTPYLSFAKAGAQTTLRYGQANAKAMFTYDSESLYYVDYSYDLVDDYPEFTATSALALYDEYQTSIALSISEAISDHVNVMHIPTNSGTSLSDLNACMPVDFSMMPNEFGEKDVDQYDYIQRVFEGNEISGEIRARVKSPAVRNGRWQNVSLSYIAKQWKKNTIELYVYLPTTNTYYIPHVDGAGNCANFDEKVYANGELVEPSPAHSATHIQLEILATYFTISGGVLYENTIKGNSLPLKIYKDGTYTTTLNEQQNVYHSLALPSVAAYQDSLSPSVYDYYTLDYYCFGTDAQAIKLVFTDNKQYYLRKYKLVIYHGQDNQGNTSQASVLQQRILEGDEPELVKSILWTPNIPFDVDGGVFLGWSQRANATTPDTEKFGPTCKFKYDEMKYDVIHLYAVWSFYTFGSNDTSITIQNSGEQTYTIAEVTIDPTITFASNPPLKDKLIVNFGDD